MIMQESFMEQEKSLEKIKHEILGFVKWGGSTRNKGSYVLYIRI